jgi:3-hydroxyacyl-[acyl-carrier-protein] dehydratase
LFIVAGRFDLDQLLDALNNVILAFLKITRSIDCLWPRGVARSRFFLLGFHNLLVGCNTVASSAVQYNLRSRSDPMADTHPATEAPAKTTLDINDILRILPHRFPFLMIDRVIDITRRERIVAIKNVTMNEPFFAGHFPNLPIMPGVLIVEAIAQAGGALLLTEVEDRADKLMVFTGIERARFRRPVVPGDQLRIEVEVKAWRVSAVRMEGKVFVGDKCVAEATVTCQLVDRSRTRPEAADDESERE